MDSRDRLSATTVALHWVVGLGFIAVLATGLYLEELPRGPQKNDILDLHNALGMLVFAFAIWRLLYRWRNGFPEFVGPYSVVERRLARLAHWTLLVATIGIPVTGIVSEWARARAIDVFGVLTLPPLIPRNIALHGSMEVIHSAASKALIIVIALHAVGALKHHLVDKDGTLRRMLGARVA